MAPTASMASVASMAPMALMVLASMALVASMVWATALKRRELSNEMLRYSPLKTWLCSSTYQAWEADGSRSSRRVDDGKVKKELMGSQIWALLVTMAWVATMASMASMVWTAQGSTDVEVPLVPMMVATNGGDEWWRRWVASMDGVDGWTGVLRHRGH